MEAVIDWVRSVGGYVHPALEHKRLNKYNKGVVMREDVTAEGEPLFYIPKEFCMSEENFIARHPELNSKVVLEGDKAWQWKNLRLVLFLKVEMENETSDFAVYLKQLPRYKEYEYHPVYQFRPECKERWSKINEAATLSIENHVNIAKMLFEEAKKYVEVTEEEVKWFYLILLTRQWGGFGLVPFADNLQHSNKSTMYLGNVKVEDVERVGFRVPKEGLKKGEQVFDNYGICDELVTYTSFGFIDEMHNDNIIRFYRLTLNNSMTVAHGLDNFKEAEIKRIFKDQRFFHITNLLLHPTIMEYLRIMNLNADDMKLIDPTTTYWKQVISMNNEGNVHMQLINLIKKGGLVAPKESVEYANRVMKKHKAGSVEWSLARLVVIRQDIVTKTLEKLIVSWVNQLQIPFKHTINLDIYHDAQPAATPTTNTDAKSSPQKLITHK